MKSRPHSFHLELISETTTQRNEHVACSRRQSLARAPRRRAYEQWLSRGAIRGGRGDAWSPPYDKRPLRLMERRPAPPRRAATVAVLFQALPFRCGARLLRTHGA
ncbi:hypothetical protein R5R35_002185 [Gryllus longicercus]|uniref:Uncharacterized protein n=1 Tax=Gryllus longicercus TaxID=2509291 RepID=A0AAN9VIW2_9ORTH